MKGLDDGSLKGHTQDESKVTYASKLEKDMEWLDGFSQEAAVLDRRVRALNPWPGTSLWVNAGGWQRLKVRKARFDGTIQGPAGKLFDRAGMVCLGTPRGALELQACQWDGKKEVDAAGFLNGLRGRGLALPLDTRAGTDANAGSA